MLLNPVFVPGFLFEFTTKPSGLHYSECSVLFVFVFAFFFVVPSFISLKCPQIRHIIGYDVEKMVKILGIAHYIKEITDSASNGR